MQKELLTKKVNVPIEEFEREHAIKDERLGKKPVPFGFINAQWIAFKEKIQLGDELWYFSSPPETWKLRCGRMGIALVRSGEVIAHMVTRMN